MNLLDYIDQIIDPRDSHGVRHPVGAMLKVVLLALLSGITCVEHMGVYAKENWDWLCDELGFRHWHPPDGETFRLLLSRLDSNLLTRVFENWMSDFLKDKTFDVALDGKACRGVIAEGKPKGKGVQLLNVFAHDLEVVLTQWSLESKKGESTVAKANMAHLIEKYPGIRLLTGDAGLSGRDLCQTIINYKKDFLIRIKGNQKEVEDTILFWFEARLKENAKPDAKTVEKKKIEQSPVNCFYASLKSQTTLGRNFNFQVFNKSQFCEKRIATRGKQL